MLNNNILFEDLPKVVSELRNEVVAQTQYIRELREIMNASKEDCHRPMNVEQAAEYLQIPLGTLYMKLGTGEIPATKPGKRYVLYRDELDKWLEMNRKNPVPLSADEENAVILAAHRRKPGRKSWLEEGDAV